MNFFKNPIFKMIKKIISWVIIGLLILLAIFLMYYIISSKFNDISGKKFEPKMSLYTIISTSMEPNIKVYDVVFDVKVNPNNIKEGDVITFISTSTLSDGMTITHRVIGIIDTENGRKFRVKGDNNSTPDSSLVDAKNVLGKVMFKLPQIGRVQFLLQSKGGWLFALLIPALFVVMYDVLKVVRLSSAKVMIEETLKEPEEDLERKQKQAELKKRLKNKIVGVVPVEPIIQTVKDDEIEVKPVKKTTTTKTKTKPKAKNKVVKEDKIENAEKEFYNEELDKIKNKDASKDNLTKEIINNTKPKKSTSKSKKATSKAKKNTSKVKVVSENDNINNNLNDYNINIKMDDIFKNISELNDDDDFMPKSK